MPLPRVRFTVRRLMAIAAFVALYFTCLHQVWPMLRSGDHPAGFTASIQGFSFFVVFLLPAGLILVGWERLMNRDP